MLVQFSFKNFKSFRDDTTLDMSATKITEHEDRVVNICNEKLLPVAAIYGANASGKSNVIEAFRFMVTYVLESFAYGGDIDDKKLKSKRLKQIPFLFDLASKDSESSFEVYFVDDEEYDPTRFTGAVEYMLKSALTLFPSAKIGVVIPHRVSIDLNKWHDVVRAACKKWNVPYIDLYYLSGINVNVEEQNKIMFSDGVTHLTAEAYERISAQIEKWMRTL